MSRYTDEELRQLLEQLRGELAYLKQGELPPEVDLSLAPILDFWAYSLEPSQGLIGVVAGHPRLRGGWIMTSSLIWIDEVRGLARTMNRYYRLGRRLGDGSSH